MSGPSGKVPVPELGDGCYFQFTFDAMEKVENALGKMVYLDKLYYGLPRMSPECFKPMLEFCVYDKDGKHVKKTYGDWAADAPVQRMADYMLDAITLAHRGKPFNEWASDVEKEAAATASKNPTKGTVA